MKRKITSKLYEWKICQMEECHCLFMVHVRLENI